MTFRGLKIAAAFALTFGMLQPVLGSTPNHRSERQLQITAGPVETRHLMLATSARIPEAGMLHRFEVQLVDSLGLPIGSAVGFTIELVIAGSVARSVIELTPQARVVVLPRPLGYRVQQGDSVVVMVRIGNHELANTYVRVTVDYEAFDAAVGRLSILPVQGAASASLENTVTRHSWQWQPEMNGRILAFSGPGVQIATELQLEDVTTGAVLWRSTSRAGTVGFGQTRAFERLGVEIEKGGVYRLTATYAHGAAIDPTSTSVLAMLLPRN